MTLCPNCGKPAKKSLKLISLTVVFSCPDCDVFHVNGSSGWVKGGKNVQSQLLDITKGMEERRNRLHEAMFSPDDDPRWHS